MVMRRAKIRPAMPRVRKDAQPLNTPLLLVGMYTGTRGKKVATFLKSKT